MLFNLQRTLLFIIFTLLMACQSSSSSDDAAADCDNDADAGCQLPLLLHVPSPEWQDQIIYFLMIDRFADGDPANNDQGAAEYDPSKESHYSGGDLKGVINRLDYIEGLGATALWTTPHIANQWWDPLVNYSGYHGYWARDFMSVDEHSGNLDDYQNLSSSLHHKGMYLIQDVVVNHTGNFFTYQGDYEVSDVTKNFMINRQSLPGSAPSQYPFNLNDVHNPQHREAGIFNWTPNIQDFSKQNQEKTFQTADLDDINTQNPVVRKALKESFGFWIKEAGVDAVRIDTAKYVEKEFYEDFLHADDGLKAIAKQTGRDSFFSFGEIYQTSAPLQDNGEKVLEQYTSSDKFQRLDAPLGFPLYKEISRVFAGGAPTTYMSYRLEAQMRSFKNPYLVTNFIDNHDVERFLASGNIAGFKQAYALMMTVPGIPTIYQGDEQAFVSSRRAMFAGGYLSEQDQFNQQAPMYLFIKNLAAIRKAHKVFSRGTIEIVKDNSAGAGVLVYKREYQGQVAYVIFNTAKQTVLLNSLQTEFGAKNVARLLASENLPDGLSFADDGSLTAVLAPQSFAIFIGKSSPTTLASIDKRQQPLISIDNIQQEYVDLSGAKISGKLIAIEPDLPAELIRVIDGKIADAKKFTTDELGNWNIDLAVADLGEHKHSVEIYWPQKNSASPVYFYTTRSANVTQSATVQDPLGDDKGPSGNYIKPLDASVGCQMDIAQAEVRTGGAVLELSIEMCELTHLWAPPNEFDHVSFTIFFDLAKDKGMKELPMIGGVFPNQQKWDLAHMVFGWANYLYWPQNSSANQEGDKLGIAPKIEVDKANKRIRFIYDGNDFGVDNWHDVSVYITTWDKSGEGNYRELSETPNVWTFGGAQQGQPKILDDVFIQLNNQPVSN
ncbi:MAG: glycosidase [Paraglaciecola sp.]|jgi:glycosidase